jgi:ariadne-1
METELQTILNQISDAVRGGEEMNNPQISHLLSRISILLKSSDCDLNLKCTINPLTCLSCDGVIPRSRCNISIKLKCGPSHLICSSSCLKTYALERTNHTLLELEKNVICPLCSLPIDYNLLNSHFQGRISKIQAKATEEALSRLMTEEGREEAKPHFDCQICFSRIKVEDGITLECDHRVCPDCIRGHSENKINSGEVADNLLCCPFDKCKVALNPYMLKSVLDEEMFHKYDKLRTDRCELRLDEDEMLFRCPRSTCDFRIVMSKHEQEFSCMKCQYKCCPKCGRDVHSGSSCEDYERWRLENSEADKRSEEYFRKSNFVKCPTCGAVVEKVSGCNFMRCYSPTCQGKNSFCFLCGTRLRQEGDHHHCVPIRF